jgi:hypothetical protein
MFKKISKKIFIIIKPFAREIGTSPEGLEGWNQNVDEIKCKSSFYIKRFEKFLNPDSTYFLKSLGPDLIEMYADPQHSLPFA